MSEEKKFFKTMFGGMGIGLAIIVSMYFLLEWLNKFLIAQTEKINPLRLPNSHLLFLVVTLLIFRKWIRSGEKEEAGKGILLISFLYVLFFFLFIAKNYSPL